MLSGVNSYNVTWKNRDILIGKIKDLIPEIKGLPERARQKATFFGQNMVLLGNVFQVSADGVTQERVPCYKGLWTIEKAPFFYYDQVTDGYWSLHVRSRGRGRDDGGLPGLILTFGRCRTGT